jgi:hypothetical protein
MKRSKTEHPGEISAPALKRSASTRTSPGLSLAALAVNNGIDGTRPWTGRHSLPAFGANTVDYLQLGQSLPYTANPFLLPSGTSMEVMSVGREMNVVDFLMSREEEIFPTASPITIPPSTIPSSTEGDAASSYPSLCGSNTSTLETVPMSRVSSTLTDGASIASRFNEMVRIQSQQSARSIRPAPIPDASQAPLHKKRSSEGSLIVPYPASVPTFPPQHQHPMEPSLSQSSIHSSASANGLLNDMGGQALAQHLSMERSESARSNSSLKLRAKESLARQNYAAASRKLQPKPTTTSQPDSASGNPATGTADGNSKAPITRPKYERPKHPKVKCLQCNEHPEGFRGEHELRRHTEAKHKSMVRKWVCRDPALAGIPHSETAVRPLHECNKCSSQKQYGAYYNAAAHLRRTHFNVKPRKGSAAAAAANRGAGEGNTSSSEKRGGKGGGDWPSMAELKNWMMEILVPMDQPGAFAVEDGEDAFGALDADDATDPAALATASCGAKTISPTTTSLAYDASTFDVSAFAGVGSMFGSTGYDLPGVNPAAAPASGIMPTSTAFTSTDLNAHLTPSGLYPMDGSVLLGGIHAGLDLNATQQDLNVDTSIHMNMNLEMDLGMPMSGPMSLDGYGSPGSSTATITRAGFVDQTLAAPGNGLRHEAAGLAGADLPDFNFDLTFDGAQ